MRTKPTKPQNQAANGTMTKTEATKRGLRPLAGPYGKGEYWMVESLCADLLRGGIVCGDQDQQILRGLENRQRLAGEKSLSSAPI